MATSGVAVRAAAAGEARLVAEVVARLRREEPPGGSQGWYGEPAPAAGPDLGPDLGPDVGPDVGPDLPRVAQALARPDVRVLVAEVAGVPAGLLVLRREGFLPLTRRPAAHVDQLAVLRGFRRRGVGRALLAAAARWAEHDGADQVVVAAPPAGREAHRFLARLGFSPLVVQRAAPVATLRRQLDESRGQVLRRGRVDEAARRAALERVVVRRRRDRGLGAGAAL